MKPRFFKTIRGKILALTMSLVLLSIGVLYSVFFINSIITYTTDLEQEMKVAVNSITSSIIDYERTLEAQYAFEIARILKQKSFIDCYSLLAPGGDEILSDQCDEYESQFDKSLSKEEVHYIQGKFHLILNINFLNESHGDLYVIISPNKILQRLKRHFLEAIFVVSLTFMLVFLVALQFQEKIVRNFEATLRELDEFKNSDVILSSSDEVELLKESIGKIKSKFYETKHLLEKSEKLAAMGELAGGIAHEINNPISVIVTHSELLESEVSSIPVGSISTNRESLINRSKIIKKMALNIGNIIYSLLRLSRNVSQDSMSSHYLKDILEEAKLLASPRLGSKKVALEMDLKDSNLQMECSAIQIAQVIAILINNAYDAVQDLKQPKISIVVREISEQVMILVQDTGPGVPAEIQKNLFNEQVTLKSEGKGTGIGLRLSKKIVQSHNGTIEYLKMDGISTFRVILPEVYSRPKAVA